MTERMEFLCGGMQVQGILPPYLPTYPAAASWLDVEIRFLRSHCGNAALAKVKTALINFESKAAALILAKGGGWLSVKIGKGVTDKSLRASLECQTFTGTGDVVWRGISSFIIPASMVIRLADGQAILPKWLVAKELSGVKARSRYRKQQFDRVPVQSPFIPEPWREEYRQALIALLPTEAEEAERVNALAQLIAGRVRAVAEANAEAIARRASADAAAAAGAKRKAAQHASRLATLPRRENVRALWKTWTKENGRLVAWERDELNVTVVTSGARAYVLLPGGGEEIVSTKNLRIVE